MDAGSLSDVRANQGCKLVNTPSSSNEVLLSNRESYFGKYPCGKLKSVNKLQDLAKIMKSKSENLQQMAQDGLGKISQHTCCDFRLSENSSKHRLLTTLIDIITSCTHSMDVLENYVKHYLPCSMKCSTNTVPQEQAEMGNNYDVEEYGLIKVPIQDIVHALVEALPAVFTEDPQLGDELKVLAGKVSRAENSCDICVGELKAVWIIIQKMFLFLSLGGNKPEIKYTIYELVSCLLSANLTCVSESGMSPLHDGDSSLPESISSIYLLPFVDDDCSIRCNHGDVKSDEDLESVGSEFYYDENGTNLRRINMNSQHQYLKIAHIESPCASDELRDENEDFETELNGKRIEKNLSIRAEGGKCNGLNEVCNDKLFKHLLKNFWMSVDSLPRSKTSAEYQPEVHNKLPSNSGRSGVADSNEKSQHIRNTLHMPANGNFPPNGKLGLDEKKSYPNSRTSSSFTNPSSFNPAEDTSTKIRTDTVQVKLRNGGGGFGLVLGVRYNSTRSSIVPVIHSIKPKSPAQKSGVLKVDDRIVAINHRCTLGITPKELQVLSKQSFSSEAVQLAIEFDVLEAEPKFGTFDVNLDKMLKIGLVFEDMKRGFPMLVSGIVKGSGAHRCGQLFPGDKIKFVRCIRNEEFDPVSCNYSKEENVLITVQRDRQAGLREGSGVTAPPCYSNPCFADSVPRRGKSCVVGSTRVHADSGALVVDQEVTLFRDPVCWDFGFLVGENPDTGRAYVTDVRQEGPASGVVKKSDRIVQINGILVNRNIENSVLVLLSQANNKVDLLIRRLYKDSKTV